MVENPYSSPSKPCFFPFLAVVFSSDRRTLELWKFKPVAAAPSAPLSYEAGAKGGGASADVNGKNGDFS